MAGIGGLVRSGSARDGISWALYDFANTIYSYGVVSYAIGLWSVDQLGEGSGPVLAGGGDRGQRGPQRGRLAGAGRDERSHRAPAALPALLHLAVRDRDRGHRPRLGRQRRNHRAPGAGTVRHLELRLPGRAHLLRRDPAGHRPPGGSRPDERDRGRDGLPGHDPHRRPDPHPRRGLQRPHLPHGRGPLRALLDPHLPHAQGGQYRWRSASAWPMPPAHGHRWPPPCATRGRSPGCSASSSAASSTPTRSTPRS